MAEKDLKALFVHQLKDTYFAENAILKALPQLAEAAQSEELKGALAVHLKETEGQVKRLEQVFQLVGERPEGVPCKAIQGILEEGQEVLRAERLKRVADKWQHLPCRRTQIDAKHLGWISEELWDIIRQRSLVSLPRSRPARTQS